MKIDFTPRLQLDGSSLISGISAGSGIIGGIIDAFTANTRMKEAEGFSDRQAAQQRAWAVEDRDYANQYNSPAAAMARYKAAGLNPNLIYGQTPVASQPVRSTPAASPYPEVGQTHFREALGNSANTFLQSQLQAGQLAIQAGQVGVLDAQKQNLLAQARKINEAEIPNIQIETDQRKLQYKIDNATQDSLIAYKNGQLTEQSAAINKLLTDTQIEQIKALPSVALMASEMVKNIAATQTEMAKKVELLAQANLLARDSTLKDMTIGYFKEHQMMPGTESPLYTIAGRIVDQYLLGVKGSTTTSPNANLTPENDPVLKFFNDKNKYEMQKADWKKYTR